MAEGTDIGPLAAGYTEADQGQVDRFQDQIVNEYLTWLSFDFNPFPG